MKRTCTSKCEKCGHTCESGHLFIPETHYDDSGHMWGD